MTDHRAAAVAGTGPAPGMGLEPRQTPTGRNGTGHSLRQNTLDPGFHRVPAGPGHRIVVLMVPAWPEPGFQKLSAAAISALRSHDPERAWRSRLRPVARRSG